MNSQSCNFDDFCLVLKCDGKGCNNKVCEVHTPKYTSLLHLEGFHYQNVDAYSLCKNCDGVYCKKCFYNDSCFLTPKKEFPQVKNLCLMVDCTHLSFKEGLCKECYGEDDNTCGECGSDIYNDDYTTCKKCNNICCDECMHLTFVGGICKKCFVKCYMEGCNKTFVSECWNCNYKVCKLHRVSCEYKDETRYSCGTCITYIERSDCIEDVSGRIYKKEKLDEELEDIKLQIDTFHNTKLNSITSCKISGCKGKDEYGCHSILCDSIACRQHSATYVCETCKDGYCTLCMTGDNKRCFGCISRGCNIISNQEDLVASQIIDISFCQPSKSCSENYHIHGTTYVCIFPDCNNKVCSYCAVNCLKCSCMCCVSCLPKEDDGALCISCRKEIEEREEPTKYDDYEKCKYCKKESVYTCEGNRCMVRMCKGCSYMSSNILCKDCKKDIPDPVDRCTYCADLECEVKSCKCSNKICEYHTHNCTMCKGSFCKACMIENGVICNTCSTTKLSTRDNNLSYPYPTNDVSFSTNIDTPGCQYLGNCTHNKSITTCYVCKKAVCWGHHSVCTVCHKDMCPKHRSNLHNVEVKCKKCENSIDQKKEEHLINCLLSLPNKEKKICKMKMKSTGKSCEHEIYKYGKCKYHLSVYKKKHFGCHP